MTRNELLQISINMNVCSMFAMGACIYEFLIQYTNEEIPVASLLIWFNFNPSIDK